MFLIPHHRKEFDTSQLNSKLEDEQVLVVQLHKKIKELQVKLKMKKKSPFVF